MCQEKLAVPVHVPLAWRHIRRLACWRLCPLCVPPPYFESLPLAAYQLSIILPSPNMSLSQIIAQRAVGAMFLFGGGAKVADPTEMVRLPV